MGFPLPNPVDPNRRQAPGDPEYGIHAFGAAWHDLWVFLTSITGQLYASARFAQYVSDHN